MRFCFEVQAAAFQNTVGQRIQRYAAFALAHEPIDSVEKVEVVKLTTGGSQIISVGDTSTVLDAAVAQLLLDMRAQINVRHRTAWTPSVLEEAQMHSVGARFVPGVAELEYPGVVRGIEGILRGDAFSEHKENKWCTTWRSRSVWCRTLTQRPVCQDESCTTKNESQCNGKNWSGSRCCKDSSYE